MQVAILRVPGLRFKEYHLPEIPIMGTRFKSPGLLSDMEVAKVLPGSITFNAAVGACARMGFWQRALGLSSRMATASLQPNMTTWTCCVSALN